MGETRRSNSCDKCSFQSAKHGHNVAGFSTSSQVQRSENATIPSKRVRQRVTVAADTSCMRCSPPSANLDLKKSILVLQFTRVKETFDSRHPTR